MKEENFNRAIAIKKELWDLENIFIPMVNKAAEEDKSSPGSIVIRLGHRNNPNYFIQDVTNYAMGGGEPHEIVPAISPYLFNDGNVFTVIGENIRRQIANLKSEFESL